VKELVNNLKKFSQIREQKKASKKYIKKAK
jgi:hypothetical protein